MKNKKNNDDLPDLYMMKDKTVEEISECSEGLDDEAKERIAKLCEKKMCIISESDSNENIEKEAKVKKYTSPKWYRAAIASAACLLVVFGVMLVKNNMQTSDPDTEDPAVTSQTEETTQTSVSETNETTYIDESQISDVQEYRKIIDEMILKYEEVNNVLMNSGEKRAVLDYSDEYSLYGITYYKVSDPRFSTKQDLYTFVETVYTKQDVEKNYSQRIESMFFENDGKLYTMKAEPGDESFINGWLDEPEEISDVQEDSFVVVKKYRQGDGQTGSTKIHFIKENGEWRIIKADLDYEPQPDDYNDKVIDEFKNTNFNLNIENISANEIFECSQPYTMPETINGYRYCVEDIFDKDKVYVSLILESDEKQIGVYDFKNNSYSEIVTIGSNDVIVKYSEDYLIIKKLDYIHFVGSDTPFISYYDINKKSFSVIYENKDNIDTKNDVLIYNNALYFDVYTGSGAEVIKEASVYKYDFSDSKLTLVRENAIMPVRIKDSIAALIINPETGLQDTLEIIEGDETFSCNVKHNPDDIYYNVNDGSVYENCLDGRYSIMKNLQSGEKILSQYPGSMRSIDISDSNNNFIAFSNFSCEEIPCVYYAAQNKLVEFNDIGKTCCHIFVKGDYGIVRSYNRHRYLPDNFMEKEIVFFQLKDQQ